MPLVSSQKQKYGWMRGNPPTDPREKRERGMSTFLFFPSLRPFNRATPTLHNYDHPLSFGVPRSKVSVCVLLLQLRVELLQLRVERSHDDNTKLVSKYRVRSLFCNPFHRPRLFDAIALFWPTRRIWSAKSVWGSVNCITMCSQLPCVDDASSLFRLAGVVDGGNCHRFTCPDSGSHNRAQCERHTTSRRDVGCGTIGT